MSIEGKHFYRFTYLKSEEWKTVRLVKLAKCGAKCEVCGEKSWSNDCHHKVYPDDIWKTKPHHLAVLCRRCHDAVHSLMRQRPDFGKFGLIKNEIWEERHKLKKKVKKPRCVFCRCSTVELIQGSRKKCKFFYCQDCRNFLEPVWHVPSRFWKHTREMLRQSGRPLRLDKLDELV